MRTPIVHPEGGAEGIATTTISSTASGVQPVAYGIRGYSLAELARPPANFQHASGVTSRATPLEPRRRNKSRILLAGFAETAPLNHSWSKRSENDARVQLGSIKTELLRKTTATRCG